MVNRYHENNTRNYRPKTVPGNSSYKDLAKGGKKCFILGTSVIIVIKMKEFTQHVKHSFAKIRFPRASTKQLSY